MDKITHLSNDPYLEICLNRDFVKYYNFIFTLNYQSYTNRKRIRMIFCIQRCWFSDLQFERQNEAQDWQSNVLYNAVVQCHLE